MEETKKGNVLLVLLLLIVIALGGFIVYDKLLKKNDDTNSTSNVVVNDVDIKHLLSLVIVKRNTNDEIQSYKISDLKDKDINDIIAACVVQDENYIEDAKVSTFRMKASEVNTIVKNLYGISNPNLSVGTDIYSVHNLSLVDMNNDKYYEAKRKDGIPFDVPNNDVFGYHNIRNISYTKNGELIIECTVIKYEPESPMYYLYGTATIKFDINNGIKFVSLDFKKEDVINSYTDAPEE